MGVDFGDGGGVVGEDARDELEGVCVPFVGYARSFEPVVVGKMDRFFAGFFGGGGGLVGVGQ